ncbi:MAG: endo-1,4-beta-xylanase, partial [Oscillospiraceae bacterium]|nr:endo-1,4-beta-xylanase [Oscillospiraceae bacterium]
MFVGANSDKSYYKWSEEEFNVQAEKYAQLFEMFQDFADQGIIDMVVFWGTDDENSWLNSTPKLRRNAALIFDRPETNYAIKPAFWSIARTSFNH